MRFFITQHALPSVSPLRGLELRRTRRHTARGTCNWSGRDYCRCKCIGCSEAQPLNRHKLGLTGRYKSLVSGRIVDSSRQLVATNRRFVGISRRLVAFGLTCAMKTIPAGASEMTANFLTIRFTKVPKYSVMEFPSKTKNNVILWQFSLKSRPPKRKI